MSEADFELEAPKRPSWWRMLREAEGALELARVPLHLPALAREPRGSGEPVVVLPGFGAGDASTAPLRAFLRWRGWDARGWGLGVNRGDVPALLPRVVERVDAMAAEHGAPVRLVGWSLGGYLAREAARDRPEAVERVITLGTPVVGGPKYTTAAGFYRRRGVDLDALEAAVAARNAVPLRVPVTAIYSERDGVVTWRACIDRVTPGVEHVCIDTTHVGLGLSPDVFRVIARRLAQRSDPASADRVRRGRTSGGSA